MIEVCTDEVDREGYICARRSSEEKTKVRDPPGPGSVRRPAGPFTRGLTMVRRVLGRNGAVA